jgi:hypothetical protein
VWGRRRTPVLPCSLFSSGLPGRGLSMTKETLNDLEYLIMREDDILGILA